MLRIRDVYPGSDFFYPGSDFFSSRIHNTARYPLLQIRMFGTENFILVTVCRTVLPPDWEQPEDGTEDSAGGEHLQHAPRHTQQRKGKGIAFFIHAMELYFPPTGLASF